VLASAAVLIALAATPAAAASETLSVGAVAKGILDPRVPGVLGTWRAALADPQPELRAAVARAVNVSGVRNLAPQIAAALKSEADPGVRIELLRAAVVVGEPGADLDLVASVRDAGEATALATSLLRVRGSATAVVHLEALRKAGFKPGSNYVEKLLGEKGLRERLARAALDSADTGLWSAVLSAGEREQPLLAEELLLDGLRAAEPALRRDTLWYLARRATGGTPALRTAVSSSVPAADAPLRERLPRELAARALGEAPRAVVGWIASLESKEPLLPELDLRAPSGDRLLTPEEKKALKKVSRLSPRPAPRAAPAMWVLGGFPAGYRDGVLASTKCTPGKEVVSGVEVMFKPDGRPSSFALLPSQLDKACQEAIRILAASSLVAATHPVPVEPALLMVILEPEFLACADEQHKATPPWPVGGARKITEPRKVHNVPPVYPVGAQQKGVEGVVILEAVISASGCVQQVQVIDTEHAGLAWPAMRAVSQWRYSPTLLDGVAVPMIMTVNVNFRLQ
jgi:TonB family protein